jgi:hypothetical protein
MCIGFCVGEGEDWGWEERLLRKVYLTQLVKFTFVIKNKTHMKQKTD